MTVKKQGLKKVLMLKKLRASEGSLGIQKR